LQCIALGSKSAHQLPRDSAALQDDAADGVSSAARWQGTQSPNSLKMNNTRILWNEFLVSSRFDMRILTHMFHAIRALVFFFLCLIIYFRV
jgi:hypothetical protein